MGLLWALRARKLPPGDLHSARGILDIFGV